MSVPTLADLLTVPTADQVRAETLSALEALGFPVSVWEQDGVAMQIVTALSEVQSAGASVQAQITAGGFLDLAAAIKNPDGTDNPDWITLLAINVYGVTPVQATPAVANLTLTNATAVPVVFGPGDLQAANLAGATYTNTGSGTVPDSGSLPGVTFVADTSGASGSAGAGTITLSNGPAGLTATNPVAVVGTDAWSNDRIAEACRERLASLSPNGAAAAYAYFATLADDGNSSLGVTRVHVDYASGYGVVTLYAAAGTSPLGGSAAPPASSGACFDLWTYLMGVCVPDSVALVVAPATVHNLTLNGTIYTDGGTLDQATVVDAVNQYLATLPIGGVKRGSDQVVPLSGIVSTIMGLDSVRLVDITTPSSDTVILMSDICQVTTASLSFVHSV